MARTLIPYMLEESAAMKFSDLARDCLRWLETYKGYAPGTIETYGRAYNQFGGFLRHILHVSDDVRSFTDDAVQAFAEDLGQRKVKASTIVARLAALSTLARYAMQHKDGRNRRLLDKNPTESFEWPQVEQTETKYLRGEEMRAFMDLEAPRWQALARDLAIETGLRASELVRANVADVIEHEGRAYLSVTVKGRGRRRRRLELPISPKLAEFIREVLLATGRVRAEDPLLVGAKGQRLTREALKQLFGRMGRAAGIGRFVLTPHKLRHTMNVVARVGGVEKTTRSRLLAHSSDRSIERYEHLIPAELHDARDQQLQGLARYVKGHLRHEPEMGVEDQKCVGESVNDDAR